MFPDDWRNTTTIYFYVTSAFCAPFYALAFVFRI